MKFSGSMIKYIPFLAVLLVVYQHYGQRGYQGILTDLKSLTAFNLAGLQAKVMKLILPLVVYFVAEWLSKEVSNRYIKVVVKTVAYYVIATGVLDFVRSGAGYGGSNYPTGQGNVYNPYEAGA